MLQVWSKRAGNQIRRHRQTALIAFILPRDNEKRGQLAYFVDATGSSLLQGHQATKPRFCSFLVYFSFSLVSNNTNSRFTRLWNFAISRINYYEIYTSISIDINRSQRERRFYFSLLNTIISNTNWQINSNNRFLHYTGTESILSINSQGARR